MSAIVTVDGTRGRRVEVAYADRCSIDSDGRLHLFQGHGGDDLAVFRAGQWEYVVIDPQPRDARGRFVKRGS